MDTAATNYVNQAPGRAGTLQQVTSLLKWTYGLVPIVAGVDKFTHLLTNWDKYLAPVVTNIIPLSPSTFMNVVGVIEIIAGILVLVKPKTGSLVVALWLLGIVVNLLLTGQYYDIAVRDTVMAIGAFSLFMLLNGRSDNNKS